MDRALVEYAAASFHFEQADHKRFLAAVENNLGFLFSSISQFPEAHEHLDRARSLALGLKDIGTVAQVDDTRARTFLAEGRFADAKAAAHDAVRALDEGDESSLLAEALNTRGTALARLGFTKGPTRTFKDQLPLRIAPAIRKGLASQRLQSWRN